MAWSTAQVARMSGVTSRTLRHYDAIGLLRPARVAGTGLRYYEREQLLRLQRILLLRELGLGLPAIARIVDGREDAAAQLHRHHRWLVAEGERLHRLAATVARTIEELEGGEAMDTDSLFEGFDADRQARYEAELEERYGAPVRPHIAESRRRMAERGPADEAQLAQRWASFGARLVPLIEAGAPVEDPRVQAVVAEHHVWLTHYWTPDRASYAGLGQLYVDAPDFRARFDAAHPRLAEYLRDAMACYAATALEPAPKR
ncbi:MAG TPA: TipAS antibiotic-recognition domain-containing protein [Pilimelia sp.]|nr:TipAS antibiotic-recognition domain-containing protein [Pilimelia sp.]